MSISYISKAGLTRFWAQIQSKFAAASHTHTLSEITDFDSSTAPARAAYVASADVAANTEITTPTHTVGSTKLFVYVDGLLCRSGASNQYIDFSATSIKFNQVLPAGSVVDFVVFP